MLIKNNMNKCVVFLLILFIFSVTLWSQPEMYDVIIKNSTIVDGTGKAAFKGSIAIRGEKIVKVGIVTGDADIVIDGSGLVTAPGFIDIHTHADDNILKYPGAHNFIMQGVTTVVGGSCGMSQVPTKDLAFGQWLSKVENAGISINYAHLIGHRNIRDLIMGDDFKREAKAEEVEKMKPYVEAAMQSGAFGMSSFLDPSTTEYASVEDELLPLVKIVARHGGGYWPHHRHHQSQWVSDDLNEFSYGIVHRPIEEVFIGEYIGLMEAIDISRKANLPLHIAHLINVYRIPQPHPAFLEEAVAKATLWNIDKAIKEGVDITFDVTYAASGISARQPLINELWKSRNAALSWLDHLKKNEVIEGLKTREFREKIKKVYENCRLKFNFIHTKADPYWSDRFKILVCTNKDFENKTISEIADMNNTEPLEAIFDILVEDPDTIWVQHLCERYFKAAVPVLLRHPAASPNTDNNCTPSISEPEGYNEDGLFITPTPIAYGLFADFIGTLVREKKLMSLEEAVNRASYVPAQKALKLKDRGILSPGAYADIVVFDLENIRMTGDFLRPAQRPDGIEFVLVNGEVVYKNKVHTGKSPGKVLRHKSNSDM